jgi:hypothetical protein
MPEQVQYQTKLKQSGIFLVWYQTKIRDAGMPMAALVSSMPMPSYGSIKTLFLIQKSGSPLQHLLADVLHSPCPSPTEVSAKPFTTESNIKPFLKGTVSPDIGYNFRVWKIQYFL